MILITAFENTSSSKLIKMLYGCDRLILDNHREKSVERLICKLKKNTYNLVLSFGQRPLIKDKVHFESMAKDKNSSRFYSTNFDIEASLKICKEIGLNAKRSDNAGTSYCNNIYYYGLDYINLHLPNTQMCFIHIPFDKNINDFKVFSNQIQILINKLGEENE